MKKILLYTSFVCSVFTANGAVDGENLNYKLDDFRNYFCGSWGGTAPDILKYCKNMGITHIGYAPGMEFEKDAEGCHFYLLDPEYITYARSLFFDRTYPKEQIEKWARQCALIDASKPFPKNLATGWFFNNNHCTLILDYQQQKVIDETVDGIIEYVKKIEATAKQKGINFKFGGYHWDVPQLTGDFYGIKKVRVDKNGKPVYGRRQVEMVDMRGVDSTSKHPDVVHDYPTFSEGRMKFYHQLRLASQEVNPNVKLIVDPAFCWGHWQEHIERQPKEFLTKYKGALPDFVTEEFFTTNFVDDERVFKSGMLTKDMMANSAFHGWYEVAQEIRVIAAAAQVGAWSTFFGHMGPGCKFVCDVPARLKLSRMLATWENLNNTPFSKRKFDKENLVYESPTAQMNMGAFAGVRPQTNKLFFVVITQTGKVKIPEGYEIDNLYMLDNLFSPAYKPMKKIGDTYKLDESWSKTSTFKIKDNTIYPVNTAVLNYAFMATLKKAEK